MEAKSLIMSALLVSLVLGQIQVEAKSCCSTTNARNIYNTCRLIEGSELACAKLSGCKLTDDRNACPTVDEYCKLGCASSVCAAITTLQNSDASEVVNGAVEKCNQACSAFCTKGSIIAT
ncbi:probable thionin-2.4 [Salvia miltiorrhiza]|uniref:probable thionin-2.4 n=1 Tax=Salvia miltiorrhiza TaxID=226208 RepID=UPI0025AB6304|nr:probable thionin-2.4 [Salvia miltiorrhiza]